VKRIKCAPRSGWQQLAEHLGFHFHSINNAPYWDETAYYQFSLQQIEHDLEAPTAELHQMCLALVDQIVKDETRLIQLKIPEFYWDTLVQSWQQKSPSIYGRMDFSYDGKGPAKLLELNYDTPTSLYEAAFFQWVWMEDQIRAGQLPASADQFNSIQDALIERFKSIAAEDKTFSAPLYFASVRDSIEDKGTTDYLRDVAHQAGWVTEYIVLEDIGWSTDSGFVDLNNTPVVNLFKLYPWEFMFQEAFGPFIPYSSTRFFEPPWKSILSNKGILPLLWQAYEGHPNLLPAYFLDEPVSPAPGWVVKPLLSREGANVSLQTRSGESLSVDGPYTDTGWIRQTCQALPNFDDNYALIGSWVIGDEAVGIGVREDTSLITQDSSRFVPHIIL
jgi:glutathionylspermidine synthase